MSKGPLAYRVWREDDSGDALEVLAVEPRDAALHFCERRCLDWGTVHHVSVLVEHIATGGKWRYELEPEWVWVVKRGESGLAKG